MSRSFVMDWRVCTMVGAALALSACGGGEAEAPVDGAETGGSVSGEVLGGEISDDMIPLEELTSTSPPAARSGGDADEGED